MFLKVKTDFRHYQFDNFLLDAEEGVLYRDGEPVPIPRKVFDLLLLFVRSDGRVLSHDEIIQTLWADTAVEQSNLKQSIYVLRRALGELPDENTFIKTLPKRGYRFLAEVKPLSEERRGIIAEEHTVTDVFIEEEIIEDDDYAESAARLPEGNSVSNVGQSYFRRHLPFTVLLSLIIFLAAGYGVSRLISANSAATPPISLENASWQKLTNSGDVHFATISPNGEQVAYVALKDSGEQAIRVLNIKTRSEITIVPFAPVAFWGAAFTPDGSQIYYTMWDSTGDAKPGQLFAVSAFGGTPRKILEPIGSPISFSPDGKRFVYTTKCADETQKICMITADAADGSNQRVIARTDKNEFTSPNFSPDGTRILYTGGENREDGWYWFLAEMPVEGGEAKVFTEPRRGRFFGAIWFPDGKGVLLNAYATDTKMLQLWYVSYPSGEISRITNDLNGYSSFGISGDGKSLVSVELNRTNSVWSIPFSETDSPDAQPRRLTEETLLIQRLSWTPDNQILYDSFDNGRTHLWKMNDDGSNKHQITPENLEEYLASVSPDKRYRIFISNRSGKSHLWRTNIDGGEPKQLTSGKHSPIMGKFAFGGEKIIIQHFVDERWQLVQTSVDGEEMVSLTDVAPEYWDVAPDGKTIAYSFHDAKLNRNRVAVQSLEDKSKVSYLEINPRDFLIFGPEGKTLLTKPPTNVSDRLSTIYSYPVSGGEPKKLVSNPPENFYWAGMSADGRQLAWVQGKVISNVVLLARRH